MDDASTEVRTPREWPLPGVSVYARGLPSCQTGFSSGDSMLLGHDSPFAHAVVLRMVHLVMSAASTAQLWYIIPGLPASQSMWLGRRSSP